MSAALKIVLGLCVVLCFIQFIEMSRLPRDESAVQDSTADLINNLQNIVGDVVNKLKAAVDSDQVKKLIDDASKVLAETAKTAKSKIDEIAKDESS
ncbi:unnamed protein product [Ceratitis capitata]|uniref:(Mediterranean fruit fly) hypothetical protein n=1 Tax=Ceratitis capitata TaxID=7213 RepID=A0A811UNX0_CERCA|nr:unnamed protein product [Ceratitis capitata]